MRITNWQGKEKVAFIITNIKIEFKSYILRWPYQWPNRPCLKQFSDGEHTLKHKHLRCKHTYVHQKALEMPGQQIVYSPPANLKETKTIKHNVYNNVFGATPLALI